MKRLFVIVLFIVIAILVYVPFNNFDIFFDNKNSIQHRDNVIELKGKFDELELINKLNIEVHNKNYISDRLIIEGYSRNINEYVVVNGLKTNIQLSITDDSVLIGYPLIFDSF